MRYAARLVIALILLLTITPTAGAAGQLPAGVGAAHMSRNCPAFTVCDTALGIAVTPPASWRLVPTGGLPAHTIGFYAPPARIWEYARRLTISSGGTTRERNDAMAAARAARAPTHGYTHMRPPLVRISVRYGGAPGVMILNLPGQPLPFVQIILAHGGAVYRIAASGRSTLTPDQRHALASLRFIPRVGPFPRSSLSLGASQR